VLALLDRLLDLGGIYGDPEAGETTWLLTRLFQG